MVKYKSLRLLVIASLVAAGASALLAGCSTAPKPKALVELERILQDPSAREVKKAPGAAKFYRESRQYRRVSLQSYNDGELDRAQEYALLGKLRYRTAAAVSKQHKAKARLDDANAKVGQVNPEIQTLTQERDKLIDEVSSLEQRVARARNAEAQRERRQQAQNDAKLARNNNDGDAKRLAVNNALAGAKKARKKALTVEANKYAKGAFNRANNQLKSAISLADGDMGDPDSIVDSAQQAANLFGQATRQARPKYQEKIAKMKPAARRSQLRKEAGNTFGGPFTFSEHNGVRVVLAELFDKGSAAVSPSSQALVESLAELATKYDEADITIEGYTRRGDATENLATSALRAKAVRNYLTSRGVDDGRISTKGLGQEKIRYSDETAKNDRVEVTLRIPNQ